jgi:hypothetical protein
MSMLKSKVEGAGLGSVPQQWEPPDSGALQTAGARSLDGIAAKFEAGKEYSRDEALRLIQRVTRTRATDRATILGIFDSLVGLGGLESVVWKRGAQVVRRGDISTARQRRKPTRTQYEQCINTAGDWQAVPRDEAPAFRRRVKLWNLDIDDQRAAQLAEQRRLLRISVEADALS